MKRHILTALALVAVFAVGRLTVGDRSATHTERVIEHQPIERRIVHRSPSSSLTAEEVRSIVDDALAARPDPAGPTQPPVDPAALSEALAAVDAGIADGRWTTEDRDRLRSVFDRLSREQASEVMTTLFAAFNTGRAQLDTDGPPT